MIIPGSPDRKEAARRGLLAARMVWKACELAGLVRDSDRGMIGEFLDALTDEERTALLVVQAAMIPDDVAPADLLSWVHWDELGRPLDPPGEQAMAPAELYPCGTYAAWRRHKRRGELVDDACDAAHKAYRRGCPRQRRQSAGEREAA